MPSFFRSLQQSIFGRKNHRREYARVLEEPVDTAIEIGDSNSIQMMDFGAIKAMKARIGATKKYNMMDKVPCFQIEGGGFVLIEEDSEDYQEVLANPTGHRGGRAGRLHQQLSWIYYGLSDEQAGNVLRTFQSGPIEPGLFIVGYNAGKPSVYYVAEDGRIGVVRVLVTYENRRDPWFAFTDKYFKDLVELTSFYSVNPNSRLSVKLTRAAAHTLEPEYLPN